MRTVFAMEAHEGPNAQDMMATFHPPSIADPSSSGHHLEDMMATCHQHDARTQRGCALHYSGHTTVHLQHSVHTVCTAPSCVHSRATCLEGPPHVPSCVHMLSPLCVVPQSQRLSPVPAPPGTTCWSTRHRCASSAFWLLSSCCGGTYGTGLTRRTTTSRRFSSRRPAQSFDGTAPFFSDGSVIVFYGTQCGRTKLAKMVFGSPLFYVLFFSASRGTSSFGSRSFVHD